MKFLMVLLLVISTGCATSPDNIVASSVSPLLYQDYDCKQLLNEGDRVSRKLQTLHAAVKSDATYDTVKMTVGLILLWPTLFFIDGDGAQSVEYARLKGEAEAIHSMAISGKCNMSLMPPVKPLPKVKEKEIAGSVSFACEDSGDC